MTETSSRGAAAGRRGVRPASGTARIPGVDLARAVALVGMMAVHILPLRVALAGEGFAPSWAATLFSGKASALFVLLAGTGLALLTGGAAGPAAARIGALRRNVLIRAGLVALLGFGLAMLDTNVAVILVHYALLFLAALPFLSMRRRTLGWWAAGWLLASPFLFYVLRPWVEGAMDPFRLGNSPGFSDLGTPLVFAADVLLTGYYPLLVWFGFLLAGLFVGRLALSRPPVALGLLVVGSTLAVGSKLASEWLLERPGALRALREATGLNANGLEVALATGQRLGGAMDTAWFLAVSAPHSGAPLDVLHVTGCALAVLGAAQLLCMALTAMLGGVGEMLLWPLTGAGGATLTIYAGHLVALDVFSDVSAPLPRIQLFIIYVVAALLLGLLLKFLGRRGPLEALVHGVSTTLSGSR
ncbi:heparan-alpha-glucosaminide N-acetyltransferase domain-containing protein [Paeniglutamicibacter sp. R2-26]|uniref:heparan-alpha-glucosaminide N-acetyltransferase domain-containing protein n=1 Tax=Paeniglutamicibacter sp. R2-26 TaxID=3144417 RepID=UPI003EE59DFC